MAQTELVQKIPSALKEVRTRHLFAFRLDIRDLVVVGEATGLFRRVGLIQGGSFQGERLSGRILDGGNDFQIVRGDTTVEINVRAVLRTNDGALITMQYSGVRVGDAAVVQRLDAGEAVAPEDYYLRITAKFETSAGPYRWLNSIVAVGLGHREASGPIYNVFELL